MNTFCEHHKNSIKFAYRCFDRILLKIQPFQRKRPQTAALGLTGRDPDRERARSQRMGGSSVEPEGAFRIGPTGIGNRREPSQSRRVAVIGVAAKATVELGVHFHLVAVKPHAEPGSSGHPDRSVFVFQFAACDDVVG